VVEWFFHRCYGQCFCHDTWFLSLLSLVSLHDFVFPSGQSLWRPVNSEFWGLFSPKLHFHALHSSSLTADWFLHHGCRQHSASCLSDCCCVRWHVHSCVLSSGIEHCWKHSLLMTWWQSVHECKESSA
jgi:hypothetical protein